MMVFTTRKHDILRSPKGSSYPTRLPDSRHLKCDHNLVDVWRSSSPSQRYIHGGFDSFFGVLAYTRSFSMFFFTHDWCSQVAWLGVTGVWRLLGLELSFVGGVCFQDDRFSHQRFSLVPCCQFKQYGWEWRRTVSLDWHGYMFEL